jgi:hypothetical protein
MTTNNAFERPASGQVRRTERALRYSAHSVRPCALRAGAQRERSATD